MHPAYGVRGTRSNVESITITITSTSTSTSTKRLARFAAALVLLGVLAPLARAQWPEAHGTAGNNARLAAASAVTDVTTSPTWTTGAASLYDRAALTLAGGRIYAVAMDDAGSWQSDDDTLWIEALDAADGRRAWRSAPLPAGNAVGYGSIAAVTVDASAGALYYGASNRVHRLDARTGAITWSTPLTADTTTSGASMEIINASAAVAAGRVFVATYGDYFAGYTDKQLVALDAATGAIAWSVKTGGTGRSRPIAAPELAGGIVLTEAFDGATSHGVAAFRISDGTPVWNSLGAPLPWSLAYRIEAPLVLDAGRIYGLGYSGNLAGTGRLFCADAATGSLVWVVDSIDSDAPPLVAGGKVFVFGGAFGASRLVAYDTADGSELHATDVGGNASRNAMAATAEHLYFAQTDFYASDPTPELLVARISDGQIVSRTTGGQFDGAVALDRFGGIYAHASDGTLAGGRIFAWTPASAPAEVLGTSFVTAQAFTDHDTPAARFRLSRSSAGALLPDGDGAFTLAYFDGGEDTSISNPSSVWLRAWNPATGWGTRQRLDTDVGGRHPALARRADGDLLAVWHDHRHTASSEPGASIANIEIYGDLRPAGGAFTPGDIRLTNSGGVHGGDNGYLVKAATLPDGRFAAAWYDFHWNPGKSEICLSLSGMDGIFPAPPAMDTLRLTGDADRAAGDEAQPFTVPAVAATPDGLLHIAWGTGTGTSDPNLYYGVYNPATSAWVEKGLLATNTGGFWDPAKLVVDQGSGDLWLVATRHGVAVADDDVVAWRRAAGAGAFDPPQVLAGGPGRQSMPDAAFDRGILHVVYTDGIGSARAVRHKALLPAWEKTLAENTLTAAPGYFERPAIAADAQGRLLAVWEESSANLLTGRLWHASGAPVHNAAGAWTGYR